MTSYILNRLAWVIPTFLGITLIVFGITRFVPGGPMEKVLMQGALMGAEGGKGVRVDRSVGGAPLSDDQLSRLKAYYGFDKPWYEAYLVWLGKVLQLDLGRSTRYNEPVWGLIVSKLPVSTYYGVMTMLITYLICIPLGIVKALRHNSPFDNFSSVVVFVGYALPGYVVAIILLVVFAANLEWFPLGGFTSKDFADYTFFSKMIDIFEHSVLPLSAEVLGSFAVMTFLMKNTLLENISADYVRTAMAKGLSFKKAVYTHAVRNSLIPMATHFGQNISIVLTGSFLIEKIFNIDGLGLLGYDSLVERDYPVVMGTLVVSSLLFLIGNILSDISVALVDPRVQFK
jgi:microcin C transport system permease protein